MTEPRIVSLPLSALRSIVEATGTEVALRTVDEFKHGSVQGGIDDALFGTTQDVQTLGEVGAWKATPPVWAKLVKQAKDGLHLLDEYLREIEKLGDEAQGLDYAVDDGTYDNFKPEAGAAAIKLLHKAADLWDKKYAPKLQPVFKAAHDIVSREQRGDFWKDRHEKAVSELIGTFVPIVTSWEGFAKTDIHDMSKDIRNVAKRMEQRRDQHKDTAWVQDAVYYYASALNTDFESGAGHEFVEPHARNCANMLAWVVVLLPKLAFAMKQWGEGAIKRAIVADKPMPQGVLPSRKREAWTYDEGRAALAWAKKALDPTPLRQLPPAIKTMMKDLTKLGEEMLAIEKNFHGIDYYGASGFAGLTDEQRAEKLIALGQSITNAKIHPRLTNITEPLGTIEGARGTWGGPLDKLRQAVQGARNMAVSSNLDGFWHEEAKTIVRELHMVRGATTPEGIESLQSSIKTSANAFDRMYRGEYNPPRTPFPEMADALVVAAQLLPYLYAAATIHAEANPGDLDIDAGKVGPWALRLWMPNGWRKANLNKRPRDTEKDMAEAVSYIHHAATFAYKLYRAAGVHDRALAGPIIVKWRDPTHPDDSDGKAAGWYSGNTNTLIVYADQFGFDGEGDIGEQDAVWTLIHELAHRVYYRGISTNARNWWHELISQMGEPMSPEMQKVVIATAIMKGEKGAAKLCKGGSCSFSTGMGGSTATVHGLGEFDLSDVLRAASDKDKSFASTIWWWYQDRYPHEQFINWLQHKKYTAELPTEYGNVTPIEAWPEAVANTLLRRPRTKEGRNTSEFIRAVITKLFRQTHESVEVLPGGEVLAERARVVRVPLAKLQEQVVPTVGGLGLKREELPQIDSDKVDDFLTWLREKGIVIIPTQETARLLKPSQGELESDKVAKMAKTPEKLTQGKIITSNDGYILDGHHRWAAFNHVYPEGNLPTWQVGLPIRELIALAMSYHAVEVREIGESIIAEAEIAFNAKTTQALRADYLMLMKNVPRVDTPEKLVTFGEGVRRFKQYFESIFYGASLHGGGTTPFTHAVYTQNHKVSQHYHDEIKAWDAALRKAAWGVTIELSAPGYSPIGERQDFGLWLRDREKWKGRLDRAARALWKELDRIMARVTSTFDKEITLRGGHDAAQVIEIEGVKVILATSTGTFAAYDTDEDRAETWRAALRHYHERANRVMPWLWQYRLPLKVTSAGIGDGGNYQYKFVEIAAHTATEGYQNLTHIYAHEMGHHAFKNLMRGDAEHYWDAAIKSDKTMLDLREVLDNWPTGEQTMLGYAERLRRSDPHRSLHLEMLALASDRANTYLGVPGVFDRDDLLKVLADGTTRVEVPAHPVTWYGAKNSEETFCEAIGRLVAYGPKAVHPLVQRLLHVVLGNALRLGESTATEPTRTVSVPLRDLRK